MIWNPTGSPPSSTPTGMEIAGCPLRLEGMVHTSLMYIASGSWVLAPSAKAVVGLVGDTSTSTSS